MSLILAVAAGGALGVVGLSLGGFFSGLTLALPLQAVAWWALLSRTARTIRSY